MKYNFDILGDEQKGLPGKAPGSCIFNPKERKDCGYFDIKGPECKGKGCCWDTKVKGVPWCFFEQQLVRVALFFSFHYLFTTMFVMIPF